LFLCNLFTHNHPRSAFKQTFEQKCRSLHKVRAPRPKKVINIWNSLLRKENQT
jgi:hypothetical protein